MKYGIFSDVHGNLEAFKVVLDFYARQGIKKLFFCGDLVGYGPNPLECIMLASSIENLTLVAGNHDAAVVGKMKVKWFNDNAASAIEFARSKLTGFAMNFLYNLPLRVETPHFTMVHGSPGKPLMEYLISEMQFLDNLKYWKISPCFIGHTHMPCYFSCDKNGFPHTDFLKTILTVKVDKESVIINPGSVGQPRDGDPRASCGIYNSYTREFELHRLYYDVGITQTKMKAYGMPDLLIERLGMGL